MRRDLVRTHPFVGPFDRLAQLRLSLHLLLEAGREDGRGKEEVHADAVQEELVAERVGQACRGEETSHGERARAGDAYE